MRLTIPLLDASSAFWNPQAAANGSLQPSEWRQALKVASLVWVLVLGYGLFFFQPNYRATAVVRVSELDAANHPVGATPRTVANVRAMLHHPRLEAELWEKLLQPSPKIRQRLGLESRGQWRHYFSETPELIRFDRTTGSDQIHLSLAGRDPYVSRAALEMSINTLAVLSQQIHQRLELVSLPEDVLPGRLPDRPQLVLLSPFLALLAGLMSVAIGRRRANRPSSASATQATARPASLHRLSASAL
jgi:hypothetical protein